MAPSLSRRACKAISSHTIKDRVEIVVYYPKQKLLHLSPADHEAGTARTLTTGSDVLRFLGSYTMTP